MKWGTFVTVVLGVLAVGAPIAWDQYKSSSALEVHHTFSASLVEKTAVPGRLEVRYGARPVDQVTQLSFTVTNTGRTPIRDGDVVSPLTLILGNAEVLDTRVDRTEPRELTAAVEIDGANHSIAIRFPLLNPGDVIYFSVWVNGPAPEWQAIARITGIKSLTRRTLEVNRPSATEALPKSVYFVAAGTAFVMLLSLVGLIAAGKEVGIREMVRKNALTISRHSTRADYEHVVHNVIRPLKTKSEVESIVSMLEPMPNEQPLTAEEQDRLTAAINSVIEKVSTGAGAATLFVLLSMLGLGYLAYALLLK